MVAGLDSLMNGLMNGHWPVNAMVIAGLSKYESASSNPAANTDVVVAHYIRRLTVECQVLV